MELQIPASLRIPQLVTDLAMCEPLSIKGELGLRSLIHPDLDLRRVCFPGTVPGVGSFLPLLSLLLPAFLLLQTKRLIRQENTVSKL